MNIRSALYTLIIRKVTLAHYEYLLSTLPRGAHLLDVGIGNGLMLDRLWAELRKREIRVEGIDVVRDYLKECETRIIKNGLCDLVSCREIDAISYFETAPSVPQHIYFGASFMLVPDQQRLLTLIKERTTPESRIHFCLTLLTERNRFVEWWKPRLKHLTTIDFGPVTYRDEFLDQLALAGFDLDHEVRLPRVNGNANVYVLTFKPHVDVPHGMLQEHEER